MKTKNMDYIKKTYPRLYKEIEKNKNNKSDINIFVEDTKDGNKTIKIETKDKQNIYLHSKYSPVREAQRTIDNLVEKEDIDKNTYVVFYGIGLGYHVDIFLKQYPNVEVSLYEPSKEVFKAFLETKDLKEYGRYNIKNIYCEYSKQSMNMFLNELTKKLNKKIVVAELPVYENIFTEQYKGFFKGLKETIRGTRRSIYTNLSFQKRWIINSMKNFKEVLNTPNIIIEKRGQFKGKTAILVAAGPSLNEEIENLRYIKDNGLAYIFSVGSAINTLIHHNIYPDAATTYDPKERNQRVFEMVKEKEIKDIPIIFGTSVGYETLENYLGDKYHMITSQDTTANYFLKNEDGTSIGLVQDAPTIAVVTLQLLYELGFSKILLVGQNLAFVGNVQHSEGISYSPKIKEEELEKALKVKDVHGNEIYTNEGYNSMKEQIEMYIKIFTNTKILNTTKGGAHIEGTKFQELKGIIDNDLKAKIVEENWLSGNRTNYDKEYLKLQIRKMDREYKRAGEINKEYKKIINGIERASTNGNFKQAENLYIKLDKQLRRLENNDYYKNFVLPMNRVQYKILADNIDNLNGIKDPYEKSKNVMESFDRFLTICLEDIDLTKEVYEEMKEEIMRYMGGNENEKTNSNS